MEVRKYVSKSHILERVNEFDIFKAYVSDFKEIGKKFRSDLRRDPNPSCIIGKSGNRLFYRDFSETKPIDCFAYMMRKYSITFQDALEMINLDFKLKLTPLKKIIYSPKEVVKYDFDIGTVTKEPTEIRVQLRPWSLIDKAFWFKKYGITLKELKFFRVFPIAGFWVKSHYFKAGNLSYGYYFGILSDGRQGWKIYQPNEKQFKWITNCPETIYQGFDQLPWVGDKLIITKSLKDVMMFRKLGIPAIAPQGETVNLTEEFLLKLYKRFSNILLLYDNDRAGVEASLKIAEQHNIPYCFIPDGIKDASDYVEKHSIEALGHFINKQWEQLLQNTKLSSLNG